LAPSARQVFWFALAASVAARAWFSVALPVTADEAYFALWGRHPAAGYYDHPPMVGWLLAAIVPLSDAAWAIRLPALALPVLVALAVRAALARWLGADARTADLAGTCTLLVPMYAWDVLITTDTPLVLFSVLSLLAFLRAARTGSRPMFALAGVFLGAAFLSKYFAVLLGLAYLAWGVRERRLGAVSIVVAAALPAGLANLWWNLNECWSNVMFNAINRHEGAGLNAETPLLFVSAVAYLAGPPAWFLWRDRARLRMALSRPQVRALVYAWAVPLAVFALLSPGKRIGLHWMLAFVPALVMTVALVCDRRALGAVAAAFGALTVAQSIALGGALLVPLEAWRGTGIHDRLVFVSRTPEVLAGARRVAGMVPLAADRYSSAAVLAYHARADVFVFGAGSSHARQDDLRTDFRALAGRDVAILRRERPALEDYRSYFRFVEILHFVVNGSTFYVVLGKEFDFEAYKERVLKDVRDRYYRRPAWLPAMRCGFCERYFGSASCAP